MTESKIKVVPQATGPLSIVKLTLTATDADMRVNRSRERRSKDHRSTCCLESKAKRNRKNKTDIEGGGPLFIYVFQSASDHALRPERA